MKIPQEFMCRQHLLNSGWPPGHLTLTSQNKDTKNDSIPKCMK